MDWFGAQIFHFKTLFTPPEMNERLEMHETELYFFESHCHKIKKHIRSIPDIWNETKFNVGFSSKICQKVKYNSFICSSCTCDQHLPMWTDFSHSQWPLVLNVVEICKFFESLCLKPIILILFKNIFQNMHKGIYFW